MPFPKNPAIAQIFTQMGRSEELGTGIRNVFKYSKAYSGSDVVLFSEEDVFVTRVPLMALDDTSKFGLNENLLTTEEKNKVKSKEKSKEKIIQLLNKNKAITIGELANLSGISIGGVEKIIRQLKANGIIERIGPDKGGYWKVKI